MAPVTVDGGGGRDVANDGGDGFHVHAVLQGHGGEGVAQVVEANVLAVGPLKGLFQFAIDALRIDGRVLLDRRREHPAGVRPLLQLLQDLPHSGRQNHDPVGAFRLRLGEVQAAVHVDHLALDVQLSAAEVQIVPLQRADLAPAHTGSQLQQHQLIEAVLLCLDQKALHLLASP